MNDKMISIEKVFRPEIEGLRVIAALLVAIYHIWFGRVSGGVDVFFVVSGFLITTSIISTINRTGDFKFIPYITKLLKRLLPSVFTILAVVIILSLFWLPSSIFDKTLKEIVASMFYYQNWQLAFSNTDYLDANQMKTPVEHFWAMSIQGQFYIIWFLIFALVVFFVKKYQITRVKSLLNILLSILFIGSLLFSIYLTAVNQPFAYFITFTRVWEFALGGLLCINLSKIKVNNFLSIIFGWLGLVGLILTGLIFDVSTSFPGYIALWPMLCAVMIIVSGTKNTKFGVKRFLGSPIMIKLGGLSFGLYLWHWVILSFYNYNVSEPPSLFMGVLIIVISIMLSFIMTNYVESPIRSTKSLKISFKKLGFMAFVNLVLIIGLFSTNAFSSYMQAKDITEADHPGAMVKEENIVLNDANPIPSLGEAFDDLPISHLDNSNQGLKETAVKVGVYGKTENYEQTIAVVGSSHSEHWLGAVIAGVENTNYRVLSITRSGTRFSTGYEDDDLKGQWVSKATEYIKNHDIDLVISHVTAADTENTRIQQSMVDKLNEIYNSGIKILALRDNPRYDFNVLETLDLEGEINTISSMNSMNPQKDEAFWQQFNETNDSFYKLDLTNYFQVDGEYRPIIGNVVVYRDNKHMTNTFSESFGPIFSEEFEKIFE
ncbi:acyltransferase family protein [Gracilibacillus timonensis]|uniref:acyltransferase family protein n=1 Tax=Gracilibacillus timonensis TaxID=1816696 RepID=UPI0008245F56|nr:acyltransferase family protein [Gracilibacillus timonensis]